MISLTEKAAEEVQRIFAEKSLNDDTGLLVSLRGGGCSGMTYVLDFATPEAKGDTVEVVESQGVKLLVDKSAAEFLKGMQIDYVDDLLNRGFKFENPNANHTCGCGTSFQV